MTTEELARWLERNCPGGGTLWPEAAKAAARLRELEHESRRLREENEAWNVAAITLQAENERLRALLESEAEDATADAAVDALAVEHLLRDAGLDWTDIPTAVEQLIQGG